MPDHAILHDDPRLFLDRDDRNGLRMAGLAASTACALAADAGLVVTSIEGGRWRDPGFEAWLDCIWRGKSGIDTYEGAREANLAAAKYIVSEMGIERPGGMGLPDVFMVSARPYLRARSCREGRATT